MNTKGLPPGPTRPPAPVGCWSDRRQNGGLTAQEAIGAKGAYGRLGGAAAAQGGGICTPRSECVLTEVLPGTGYAQIQRHRARHRPQAKGVPRSRPTAAAGRRTPPNRNVTS